MHNNNQKVKLGAIDPQVRPRGRGRGVGRGGSAHPRLTSPYREPERFGGMQTVVYEVSEHIFPERVGHARNILSSKMSGRLEEVATEHGRFELLVDDHDRAAHPAVVADDIKIATLVRRLLASCAT